MLHAVLRAPQSQDGWRCPHCSVLTRSGPWVRAGRRPRVRAAPEPLAFEAGCAGCTFSVGAGASEDYDPGPARPVPHSGRLSSIQRPVFNQLFHPHSQEKAVKSEAALASALEQNRADIVLARSSQACLVLTPQMVLISPWDLHTASDLLVLCFRGSNPQTGVSSVRPAYLLQRGVSGVYVRTRMLCHPPAWAGFSACACSVTLQSGQFPGPEGPTEKLRGT